MVGRPAHPSAPSIFLSFEPLIGPGRVNAGVPAVWFLHIFWPMIVSSNSVVNILITRLCYYCILEELHDICIYRILWYLMQNIDGQVNTVDSSRLRANCICRGCPSTTCPMSIFTEEYNQRHCWLRVGLETRQHLWNLLSPKAWISMLSLATTNLSSFYQIP